MLNRMLIYTGDTSMIMFFVTLLLSVFFGLIALGAAAPSDEKVKSRDSTMAEVCLILSIISAVVMGATVSSEVERRKTEKMLTSRCPAKRIVDERFFVCELQIPARVTFRDGDIREFKFPADK